MDIVKKAKEIYPDFKDGDYGPSDYQPMLDSFGEIMLQIDDNDYQGDSRIILKNNNKYGLLIFGWGSCSGCDALQACSLVEELDELIEDLANDIKWFNSKLELLEYIQNKDWELEYCWHQAETKEFVKQSISMLSETT